MNRRTGLFILIVFLWSARDGRAQVIPTDTIADQQLKEVVVLAKMPELEIKADKMTYHLKESVVRSSGSLYDVLETLPGVVLNNDGSVYLNGQSGVNILIDGKQTYLSGQELLNLLKSTPATTADKIDLITHPSARYDATGNSGLIDIHTKKIKLQGLNLSLNGSFSQGNAPKGYGSFSLNRRNGKLNFFLTYSYYQGTDQQDLLINRIFTPQLTGLADEVSLLQDSYRESPYQAHYYRAGVDIFLSPSTTFGLSTSGNLTRSKNRGDMNSSFRRPPSPLPDSTLHTFNRSDRNRRNFTGQLSLTHRFAPEGKMLDASVDYLHFHAPEKQAIYNSFLHTQEERADSISGDIRGDIDLYTGQANVVLPMGDRWKVSAGGKASHVSIDNGASYRNRQGDAWKLNALYSQAFTYRENIYAAYAEAEAKFGLLSVRAGLRMEHTRIEGRQRDASADSTYKERYSNLFPSLLLEYPLAQGKLSFFYGKRITRPNYRDLSPSVYIFDDYTYEQGNTLLRPETTDNLQLSYVFKELFKADFLFSYTDDAIVKSYIVEADKRVFVTPLNLSHAITLGPRIHTGIMPLTSFWNLSAHAAFICQRYQWTEALSNRVNKHATWMAGLNNRFIFGKGWSAELTGYYNGRMAAGQAVVSPVWQVNAGIEKKIWNNKGTISLFAKDIFHSYQYKMRLEVPGQRASTRERYDNTLVGISFSYRFSSGTGIKESAQKGEIDQSKRINL